MFDLDGTLIDSKLDLALAVNATLAEAGRADGAPAREHLRRRGRGRCAWWAARWAMERRTRKPKKAWRMFLSYYHAHMLDNTVAYPGVREGLELLRAHAMAVLTNKPILRSAARYSSGWGWRTISGLCMAETVSKRRSRTP